MEALLRWHHPSGELASPDAVVEVIALGVEERAQADALMALGVTAATGCLFSGAVPAASISELLMVTR